MTITLLPRSRLRLIDCAHAAIAAGEQLYSNGRALVRAAARPGPRWHRVSIGIRVRRFHHLQAPA